ncbi:MAG: glycosyltransferase family 2 protein [Ferruginibacter sp.]|nr:glycosyltransferase family 2 protein [Ferruginibacter sp.]
MPTGISVIICCFNSASRITPTLQHLFAQKNISLSSWEVIVVDNGSTDHTAETALLTWEDFGLNKPAFKVVAETKPGLSAARLKGIDESFYDYVLFCDDDNWLDENYLSLSLKIMLSNPFIGVLGGTGNPVFEDKEPPYFWENQFHTLAVGVQSEIEGDITDERGVLYGAGMILNKAAFKILLEKFRFQFQLSDRVGGSLLSSGDHELCLALKKVGFRIFYSQQLNFKHFIPKHRTSIEYYKKLFRAFGMSYALLHVYRVNEKNVNHFKNDYRYNCLRCLKNMIVIKVKLFFKGYYFDADKYKYLNQLHQLYSSIGIFKVFVKVKNLYKQQYYSLPLFNAEIQKNMLI